MVTQLDKVGKAGIWSQNLALVTKNLAMAMYFSHKAAIHTRRLCCKGCKTPPSHFPFWHVHEIFSPVGLVLSLCYLSLCKTDQWPFVLGCTFIFYHLWHAQRKTLKRLFSFLKRNLNLPGSPKGSKRVISYCHLKCFLLSNLNVQLPMYSSTLWRQYMWHNRAVWWPMHGSVGFLRHNEIQYRGQK